MANPLTPDVLMDPVLLTQALVDVESVSRNEKAIADSVEEVLRQAAHLRTERYGNTLMARTNLGRGQRVVLAGHLDTVPHNDNFPSTVVDDLIYGCGTADTSRSPCPTRASTSPTSSTRRRRSTAGTTGSTLSPRSTRNG